LPINKIPLETWPCFGLEWRKKERILAEQRSQQSAAISEGKRDHRPAIANNLVIHFTQFVD
jgi:hypothetical protein